MQEIHGKRLKVIFLKLTIKSIFMQNKLNIYLSIDYISICCISSYLYLDDLRSQLASKMSVFHSKMVKSSKPQAQPKNCAKNLNLNNSTINQMSYIQTFFHQYLPSFYLQLLRQHLPQPQFLQHNKPNNIFDLTLDLILSSQNCLQPATLPAPSSLIATHWLISYQHLRDVRLPLQQTDSQIVKVFKSKLKYVNVQMLQILVRLVLCYQECRNGQRISDSVKRNIEEIGHIYPALKIQVSLSFTDINLTDWFDRYLTKITNLSPAVNQSFRTILEMISEACSFIGPLQKVFLKFTEKIKPEMIQKQTMGKNIKINCREPVHQILKKSNVNVASSVAISQKASSVSYDRRAEFDDFELFRNKKKRIIKQRLKGHNNQFGSKTPAREREASNTTTPITQKTEPLMIRSDTTQHNPSSVLYKRMMKRQFCKIQQKRTLYFGQTRKFMPKKVLMLDPELYIQNITSSSLGNQKSNSFDQFLKKTQRKPSKYDLDQGEGGNLFYVPQTPKPDQLRKMQRSSSSQMGVSLKPLKL